MLHDGRRTGDYLAALAEAVRPGDVVLDLGTGSGLLAIAAARAVVIEPKGHDILLGEAMVAEFSGDRVSAFRNYERLGYEVVGVIEGWPAGSAARWYRKDP